MDERPGGLGNILDRASRRSNRETLSKKHITTRQERLLLAGFAGALKMAAFL
jgi:hypothetical protein